MASLMERAIGAARLDAATYEEVEADPSALGQAMAVVALASVSTGIGASLASGGEGVNLVFGVLLNFVGWFAWALVAYLVGTRILPTPETQADLGQMLRTTGFSAAPGILGIVGAVPILGGLVLLVLRLWQLASMVIAVRQALDYTSTGRAVGVCVIGFVVYLLISLLLAGLVMTSVMAVGGAPAPAATMP
ncbi:MAG: YIP1 family protein [Deltaproteobacteria bacterium]|nr:YIP1 family protein [Deltaproteobacteria bacterium]